MNKKSAIPIAALLVFGTMTLADMETEGRLPNSREWLGFVIVFTMLSAGADLNIPIAGGMAMLVLTIVLLTRGPEALAFVLGKVKQPKGSTQRQPKPTPQRPSTHRTTQA